MGAVRSSIAAAAALALALLPASGAVAASGSLPTATPSQATLLALRAAHHPGYDRVVLEFDGSRVPSATVRYVSKLVHDGSGQTVSVPGDATLRIVLSDARAHDDAGKATVRLNRNFGLPNVLATRSAGDFEGVVTLGVGIDDKAAFKVTKLMNPARLVVDVSTRTVLPASNCLYLVKGLTFRGSLYTGDFLVGRLSNGRFTGTTGAFYSEWSSVRGTVSGSRADLEVRGETGGWQSWPQTWRASQRTFSGWLPVTKALMEHYSGGGVPVNGQPCN